MKRIGAAILLATVLLSGCGYGKTNHSHTPTMADGSGDAKSGNHSGMNHANMSSEQNKADAADVQAVFTLSPKQTGPNQDTTITIQINDKKGKAIQTFDVEHEKQMHFIVVSKDLSFFNHIHPTYKGKGKFTVTTQFPHAGEYELIADFVPDGMGDVTRSQWITIPGNTRQQQAIVAEPSLTKVVDGKEVTLSFDHLMAGMEVNLTYEIKDASTKLPVTDLQPYLGAIGHVVILNDQGGEYLHVHPLEENGSGPDAKFMATFPHSGIFKMWGQFEQDGKVFTVPFVVEVP